MSTSKQGRNDPCPCGSGKKYKNCCLNTGGTPNSKAQAFANRPAIQIAWMHYQKGQIKQAEVAAHKLIQAFPRHAEALHLLGVIALRNGNTKLAEEYLQVAVSTGSSNPVLFGNLGLTFHEQGKLDQAEAHYRKAISLNPSYADAYYNLHALLLDRDVNASIQCLEKVVNLVPNDLDACLILGILLDRTGRHEQAEQYLRTVRNGPELFRSRLDAWSYIKNAHREPLPMTGSSMSTFKFAFQAANPDGLVLEFGVRHGNTLRQIADLAGQKVHGFDSFEGLPEVWHHEPKGSYTTKGVIPVMPENVELHVGWFEDTLPRFLETNKQPVRLANVDCDIYSSTKTVLAALASRIIPGSVLIFDEYIGNEHWREDEYKAFQEAVKTYNWRYEYLSFSMFTKQVAVRIL